MKIASINNNYNSKPEKQPAFKAILGDTFAGGLKGLYGWYERAYGLDALERMIAKDRETTQIVGGFWKKKSIPRIPVIERLKALVVKAPDGTDIHPTLDIGETLATYDKHGKETDSGSYDLLVKMPKTQAAEVAEATPVAEVAQAAEAAKAAEVTEVAKATETTKAADAAEAEEPIEKHRIFEIPEDLLEYLYSRYRKLVGRFQAKQDTEIAINAGVARTMGDSAK